MGGCSSAAWRDQLPASQPAGIMSAKAVPSGAKAPPGVVGKGAKPKTSDEYARQFARAAAEAVAPRTAAGRGGAGAAKPGVKPKAKAGATAAKPTAAAAGPKAEAAGKENEEKAQRDAKYRNLVNPKVQEARRKQHIDAFKNLSIMSIAELQVEFVVCVRAQHYRDALMYSEILMEKDPNNAMVAQFQPLLASLAVSTTESLVEDSDSSGSGESEDEDEDGGEVGAAGGDGGEGATAADAEEEEESSEDDAETAWMWSDTWRTDPDDAPASEEAQIAGAVLNS